MKNRKKRQQQAEFVDALLRSLVSSKDAAGSARVKRLASHAVVTKNGLRYRHRAR